MRTAYQHQLETLKSGLQDLLQQATHNLQLATSALLNADLSAAEHVISGADKLSVDAHEMAVLSVDAAQRVIYLVTGEDPELDELAEATQEAAEHD